MINALKVGFRSPPYRAALIMAVSCCVLAIAWFFLQQNKTEISTQSEWIEVRPRPLTIRLSLVGRLEPAKKLTIIAPFDGNIRHTNLSHAETVVQGQTLLALDTTHLDMNIRQALADLLKSKSAVQEFNTWSNGLEMDRSQRALATAKMNLGTTQRKLQEARALFQRGIIARQEVDALEQQEKFQTLDLDAAHTDLRKTSARGQGPPRQIAEMELKNAQEKLDALNTAKLRQDITAPFAGIVLDLPGPNGGMQATPIQPGARVTQGQPLFELASLEHFKAIAQVDEGDVNQLKKGQSVIISGEGFGGLSLQGHIESIAHQNQRNATKNAEASYEVTISIPILTRTEQAYLRAGMSARVVIVVYRNDHAVVVPNTAIKSVGAQARVSFRRSLDEMPQQVAIRRGRATTTGVEIFGIESGYVEIENKDAQIQ